MKKLLSVIAVALMCWVLATKLEYVDKDEAVFCDGELRSEASGLHWKKEGCVVEIFNLEAEAHATISYGKKDITLFTKIKVGNVEDYVVLRERATGRPFNFTPDDLASFAATETRDTLTILRQIADAKKERAKQISSEQTQPILELLNGILELKDIKSMKIVTLEIGDS